MDHGQETVDLDSLAARAALGDEAALDQLLSEIQPRVRRICGRMLLYPEDAEEAAQDALLLVSTRIQTFAGRSRFTLVRSIWLKGEACWLVWSRPNIGQSSARAEEAAARLRAMIRPLRMAAMAFPSRVFGGGNNLHVIPGPRSGARDPDPPRRQGLAQPARLGCPPPACPSGSGLACGAPE